MGCACYTASRPIRHATVARSAFSPDRYSCHMWSAYLDTRPTRIVWTRGAARFARNAYYGPFAALRTGPIRRAAPPGRRWVRVRNIVSGVSSEDLAAIYLRRDARTALAATPQPRRLFLGREVCGQVVELGPDVEFLRVGDRVAYQMDQCCATRDIEPPCVNCAAGSYVLCENRFLPGPQSIGGGWGDEMLLHERQLFLVPDELSDEQAALLEPTSAAIHAVLRHPPQPGENALVIGAGASGLLLTQTLGVLAPHAVVSVLARYPFQAEEAERAGATHILRTDDPAIVAARVTGGRHYAGRHATEVIAGGFDVIYDCVGSAETIQRALRWVRAGGTVVQTRMWLTPMQLDLTPVWQREIRLVGAVGHGSEDWPGGADLFDWSGQSGGRIASFALAAALMRQGALTPQRLVTHRFPLRELRFALRTARDKAAHGTIKVLLDVDPVIRAVHVTAAPAPATIRRVTLT
jgi:threonine dehydrogenase-like Zn-dependent dehydrogenase